MARHLIIIDMQNDFVTGALGSKAAQEIIPNILKRIAEADNVLATKDTHFKNYLKTFEGRRIPVEHCILDTPGHDLVPELAGLIPHYRIIEKETFGDIVLDTNINDAIEDVLEDDDIFELCGVCTDICVIANAVLLRTMFPDNRIEIRADCCAGTTPEKHRAALEVMKSLLIDVIE